MIRASPRLGKSANTDANGEFEFNAIPLGEYTVTVANPGFEQSAESVLIKSETEPYSTFSLKCTGNETVTVTALGGPPTDRHAHHAGQSPGHRTHSGATHNSWP